MASRVWFKRSVKISRSNCSSILAIFILASTSFYLNLFNLQLSSQSQTNQYQDAPAWEFGLSSLTSFLGPAFPPSSTMTKYTSVTSTDVISPRSQIGGNTSFIRSSFLNQPTLPPSNKNMKYNAVTSTEALAAMSWISPHSQMGGKTSTFIRSRLLNQPCSADGFDYQLSRYKNRMQNKVTICDGPISRIECLLEDGNPKPSNPTVRTCWVRSAYPPSSDSPPSCAIHSDPHHKKKEPEGCGFTAYCSPVRHWRDQGGQIQNPLFDSLGKIQNYLTTNSLKIRPVEEFPESYTKPVAGANDVPPTSMEYVVLGDCNGRWNLNHCMADPLNLSVIQYVLGFSKEATRVNMFRGLNYDDLPETRPIGSKTRPLYDLWPMLSSLTFTRKDLHANLPVRGSPMNNVVFSPPPFTALITGWSPKECSGLHVSHTIQNFRSRVDSDLDAKSKPLFTPAFLNETVRFSYRMKEMIDSNEFDSYILIAARNDRRQILNKLDMFEALKGAFADKTILLVELTASTSWHLQCFFWRNAKIVIGIHGANLGCAAFLSPGQGLIEGAFGCKPSEFKSTSMLASITLANGAMYRCVNVGNCPRGDCMEKGGTIDVDSVVESVRDILDVKADESGRLSTWIY